MKKGIGIAIMLIALATVCFAQDAVQRFDARQHHQRARIQQGRATGVINHREAARLNAEQRNIRRSECRAKADGQITPSERLRLHREQQRAHRDIRRQRHR
jgi:LDH2 family malate/lactate/ureidoglycolate dehydrogenase